VPGLGHRKRKGRQGLLQGEVSGTLDHLLAKRGQAAKGKVQEKRKRVRQKVLGSRQLVAHRPWNVPMFAAGLGLTGGCGRWGAAESSARLFEGVRLPRLRRPKVGPGGAPGKASARRAGGRDRSAGERAKTAVSHDCDRSVSRLPAVGQTGPPTSPAGANAPRPREWVGDYDLITRRSYSPRPSGLLKRAREERRKRVPHRLGETTDSDPNSKARTSWIASAGKSGARPTMAVRAGRRTGPEARTGGNPRAGVAPSPG